MMAKAKFVELAGSKREPMREARVVAETDPSEIIDVTVRVRPGKRRSLSPKPSQNR